MARKYAHAKHLPQGVSLESHQVAWDFVAAQYAGGTALPAWGTRGELQYEQILEDVKGRRVLEIGFGSGDSIIYLIRQGAGSVVGIDFSKGQHALASSRIARSFKNSPKLMAKVELRTQSMDSELPAGPFDAVIAVYSVGWSEQPEQLFRKIYTVLNPGGYFYFSWDHYLSRVAEYGEGGVRITKSYHEPMPLIREDWKGSGQIIETHQLRPSDWFALLIKAGFVVDGFWEPKPNRDIPLQEVYSQAYANEIGVLLPTCVVFRARKGGPAL